MKLALISVLLAVVAISFSDAASLQRTRRQLVPAEFRNINIENYLKNPRSVLFQLKCIVYDGPCDRIGKYLKVTIPELITGTCGHCSPSDRQTAGRLVAHIQKNFPKEWHDAIKKYQGGQSVKPEDAQKFESLLGVKIDSEFVSSTTTTTTTTTSTVAPAVVPSSIAPVSALPVQSPASARPVVSSTSPILVETKSLEVAAPTPVQYASPAPAPVQYTAPGPSQVSSPSFETKTVEIPAPEVKVAQPAAQVPVVEVNPSDDSAAPTRTTV